MIQKETEIKLIKNSRMHLKDTSSKNKFSNRLKKLFSRCSDHEAIKIVSFENEVVSSQLNKSILAFLQKEASTILVR